MASPRLTPMPTSVSSPGEAEVSQLDLELGFGLEHEEVLALEVAVDDVDAEVSSIIRRTLKG
jgi:hypothetical protein